MAKMVYEYRLPGSDRWVRARGNDRSVVGAMLAADPEWTDSQTGVTYRRHNQGESK